MSPVHSKWKSNFQLKKKKAGGVWFYTHSHTFLGTHIYTHTYIHTHTQILPLQVPLRYLWVLIVVFNFYFTSAWLISIYLIKYKESTGKKVTLCLLETGSLSLTFCLRFSFWLWPGISWRQPPYLQAGSHLPSQTLKKLLFLKKSLRKMGCWTFSTAYLDVQQPLVYGNLFS